MKECFKDKRFNPVHAFIIGQANHILEEYTAAGYNLTLRQLYYQYVARDVFPDDRKWAWNGRRWVKDSNGTKNAPPNYDWLGSIINSGRLAGVIDWALIEDRTRALQRWPFDNSPETAVDYAARTFDLDPWKNQEYRPEVWVEKEALAGIIEQAVKKWRIPFFSCRGYTSQSEQYKAGKRMQNHHYYDEQKPIVFHLGDHDPSGCDMTRDNKDRLSMFAELDIPVIRLALNMDQIKKYNPPPNPAKFTDCRCNEYVKLHGYSSWELDALTPDVLEGLIDEAVGSIIDRPTFDADRVEMERQREDLTAIARNYSDVMGFISSLGKE